MSRAQELAKEISTAVLAKVALNYKTATIQQMNDMVASVIASKLEPLVSDAERYHKLREWAFEDDQESEATND